jgi:hypothetical protein
MGRSLACLPLKPLREGVRINEFGKRRFFISEYFTVLTFPGGI